jgi:hypothetical protein
VPPSLRAATLAAARSASFELRLAKNLPKTLEDAWAGHFGHERRRVEPRIIHGRSPTLALSGASGPSRSRILISTGLRALLA